MIDTDDSLIKYAFPKDVIPLYDYFVASIDSLFSHCWLFHMWSEYQRIVLICSQPGNVFMSRFAGMVVTVVTVVVCRFRYPLLDD